MGEVTIGGKKYKAFTSGAKLEKNSSKEVVISATSSFVAVGASPFTGSWAMGNFTLPTNGLIKKIIFDTEFSPGGAFTGYPNIHSRFVMANVSPFYTPNITTLTRLNTFRFTKTNEEGAKEVNLEPSYLFVPANLSVSITVTYYAVSGIAIGDTISSNVYLILELF